MVGSNVVAVSQYTTCKLVDKVSIRAVLALLLLLYCEYMCPGAHENVEVPFKAH